MTALHLHHLKGCTPAPLARCLKALGILRLVAEQKAPRRPRLVAGRALCLLTILDAPDLERFLLEEYAPTPF